MFCIDHLNRLRAYEIERIVGFLEPGARVLELGAGTGKQAAELTARGFKVEAIEIPDSNYATTRVFPVRDYDGRHIPFPDTSFDIVFSSNVLEHVPDLTQLHSEVRRVLRPGGYCVHVLPTHAWRFWTTLSAIPDAVQSVGTFSEQLWPRFRLRGMFGEIKRLASIWLLAARRFGGAFVQRRHGERGNILSETWLFRPGWWVKNFKQNGFVIERSEPMGLFYTGNMVLGSKWSFAGRERWSSTLGSACHIFRLRNANAGVEAVPLKKAA